MSIERPVSASSGASVGESGVAWQTLLATCERPVSRPELAEELVARGHAGVRPEAVDMVDGAIARGELSVSGSGAVAVSRQSNLNKSVNSAPAENPPSEDSGGKEPPSIEEKVREFAAEYPLRATMPLVGSHGTSVRRDYATISTAEWVGEQPEIPELELEPAAKGENKTYRAVEWGEAVRTLLEKYERTKQTTINLEKGTWRDAEHAEFSIPAENRWFASYQKKYYAQLDAWLRELCGGERPSGGVTEPSFENAKVALLTRSASSTPDGERVGPVEHAEELRGSWQSVYHTLRNTLRAEGYELGEDWQYDRRLEPHTGKRGSHGTNEAYAHEHIILVVDGDVSAADLRPVIEKHVEACEWAGAEAHGEEAIEVREPGELNDVAAYVADYCSIDPVELWEREPDYIGWAAAMDAGNIRTVSRSETAREAAKADSCKQRCESDEADQTADHGEEVRREMGSGRIVCAECGTAHGIDQSQTLVEARSPESGPSVATDGGVSVSDREEELRERWPSADAAATVGEAPKRHRQREAVREWVESEMSVGEFWACEVDGVEPPEDLAQLVAEVEHPEHDPEEVVGFDESELTWHIKSVTVDGEERPASAGNGIEMVEITDEREKLIGEVGIEEGRRYRCACGVAAYGEAMVSHLGRHGIEEPEVAVELIKEESV